MKEDTTTIDPTWISKTGGYARDKTLRDEFAELAMQAYCSDPDWRQDMMPDATARAAYAQADAMLKAREK